MCVQVWNKCFYLQMHYFTKIHLITDVKAPAHSYFSVSRGRPWKQQIFRPDFRDPETGEFDLNVSRSGAEVRGGRTLMFCFCMLTDVSSLSVPEVSSIGPIQEDVPHRAHQTGRWDDAEDSLLSEAHFYNLLNIYSVCESAIKGDFTGFFKPAVSPGQPLGTMSVKLHGSRFHGCWAVWFLWCCVSAAGGSGLWSSGRAVRRPGQGGDTLSWRRPRVLQELLSGTGQGSFRLPVAVWDGSLSSWAQRDNAGLWREQLILISEIISKLFKVAERLLWGPHNTEDPGVDHFFLHRTKLSPVSRFLPVSLVLMMSDGVKLLQTLKFTEIKMAS